MLVVMLAAFIMIVVSRSFEIQPILSTNYCRFKFRTKPLGKYTPVPATHTNDGHCYWSYYVYNSKPSIKEIY